MRMGVAALLACLLATPLSAATCAAGKPLSIAEYRAELQRLKTSAQSLRDASEAGGLLASTPMTCPVVLDGGTAEISFTWMRAALVDIQTHPGDAAAPKIAQICVRLDRMDAQAAGYQDPASWDEAHSRLAAILARREFREVRQKGLLEVWRDRALLAIAYALEWVLSRIHISQGAADALLWVVIGVLFVLVVYVVMRAIGRDRRPPVVPGSMDPVRRSAPDWLRLAREAAARAAYREAVHHAYWAAVARLEEGGAWRPDRTRTPREYLRVLPRAHTGWLPFAALTQRFERAWYGDRPVSEPEYAEVVGELEKLGCRSS